MQENFENIRSQVDIENIAIHLMGRPERGMFKYPDEKTASLKFTPKHSHFMILGEILEAIASDCGVTLEGVTTGHPCKKYALYMAFLQT